LPDLSEALLDGIVHVAANHAACDRQRGCSSQRHVLTDLGDRVGNALGERHVADFRRLDFLEVGPDGERDIRDHLHQTLEQVVTRHKIGFGVDFDDHAFGVFHDHADQPFGRNTAGLFGGLSESAFAQKINSLLHCALGLLKRCLAIHHACARAFA